MKRTKRILLFVLICALALPILCACGGEEETTSTETTSKPAEDDFIAPDVINLGGRTINVFCWDWSSGSILGYTGEILYSEEENASPVDVAKKKVIDTVEAEYNCTIDGKLENSTSWLNTVQNMVLSGTYEYDILFNSSNYCAQMVSNDLLYDLKTIKTLHLENPWWDQNAVHDLSIANRLYYVCGDINTYDDLGTWCVLFNKDLKTRLGITENFYQLVDDGDWTLDKLIEICQGVTRDENGDGVVDEHDRWAFGTEMYNIFVQVVGGGLHVVEKDENDMPYFLVDRNTEATYNALNKIIDFYNSPEVMIANGGKFDGKYANVWEETVLKSFMEGRELFYMCGLIHAATMRQMSDELGILPIPKTFAEQDTYYHTVSAGNSSYMAIPYGLPDVEEVATVIEAIAMYSRQIVTPEFYDIQLKSRDARDDESERMLDLIFSTRSFDLGPIYNWGNIMSCYQVLNTNHASNFESCMGAANEKMNEMIQQIEEYA